jgi:DamX protein
VTGLLPLVPMPEVEGAPVAETKVESLPEEAVEPTPVAESLPEAAPPPEAAGHATDVTEPTQTLEPEATEPPLEETTPDPEVGASDPRPDYQRLAYVPDGTVLLSDLPPEFYAVQLIALSSDQALVDFAERHKLKGFSAALVEREGEILFVMLLGVYEDYDRAQLAAASRPDSLKDVEPWIRSMGSLQQAMVTVDQVAENR